MPRSYTVQGKTYDNIPDEKSEAFLSQFPDAIEVESFISDKDTFDIPLAKVDKFKESFPDATPIHKKKEEVDFITGSPISSKDKESFGDTGLQWRKSEETDTSLAEAPVTTSTLPPEVKEGDPERELTSWESTQNSLHNIITSLKGTTPRLAITSAELYEGVIGDENAKEFYDFFGYDIDARKKEARDALKAIESERLETKGIVESVKKGDIGGTAAAVVDATTAVVSTAIPAFFTGSATLFTDMMGTSINDFNEAKAEDMGVTVDELYANEEEDFIVPGTIGIMGGMLERVGLKGMSKAITKKLKGPVLKSAYKMFAEFNKEGMTEWVQLGLETYNKNLGSGMDQADAITDAADKMFSEDGLETYVMGVAGAGGATAIGRVSKRKLSKEDIEDLSKIDPDDEVAITKKVQDKIDNGDISFGEGEQAKQDVLSDIEAAKKMDGGKIPDGKEGEVHDLLKQKAKIVEKQKEADKIVAETLKPELEAVDDNLRQALNLESLKVEEAPAKEKAPEQHKREIFTASEQLKAAGKPYGREWIDGKWIDLIEGKEPVDKSVDKSEVVEKPKVFTTKSGNQTVEFKNGFLEILDKQGNRPSDEMVNKSRKEYEDQFDFSQGKEVTEIGEAANPDEGDMMIIEKTTSPKQLIKVYHRQVQSTADKTSAIDGSKTDIIAYVLNNKLDPSSVKNIGDKNKITGSIAHSYFAKKSEGGGKMDTAAQEASHLAGVTITEEDLWSFIEEHQGGPQQYHKKLAGNKIIEAANDRMLELYGVELNVRTIHKAREQELKSKNINIEEYYEREYTSKEEFKADFERSIAEERTIDEPGKVEDNDRSAEGDRIQEEAPVKKEKPKVKKKIEPPVETTSEKTSTASEMVEDFKNLKKNFTQEKADELRRKVRISGIPFKDRIAMEEKIGKLREKSENKEGKVQKALKKAAKDLDKLKIKGDKALALPPGINLAPAVWNGAIATLQVSLKAGAKLADAIDLAIAYIKEQKDTKEFNEAAFRSFIEAHQKPKETVETEDRGQDKTSLQDEIDRNKEPVDEGETKTTVVGNPKNAFISDIVKDLKSGAKKYLTSAGHIPTKVFEAHIHMSGRVAKQLNQLRHTNKTFWKELHQAYGKELTSKDTDLINKVLKREADINKVPKSLHKTIRRIRDHIDALTNEMIKDGIVEGELKLKLEESLGSYMNRSYRVHDGPEWAKNVPEEIRNTAQGFIRKEYKETLEKEAKELPKTEREEYINNRIEGIINAALYNEGAPMAILSESKLGSRDMSILKKRKDIAPEIRALMGEHTDPMFNYAKSITKMANIIEKSKFLQEVKEIGMGNFLFKEENKDHYVQIASEGSESMNPLNGLYTTPEIAEAFAEFEGSSVGSAGFRMYMKINGFVKLSKTVLSMMTHARNVVGNLYFITANGHVKLNEFGGAFQTTRNQLKAMDKQTWTDKYNKYLELGVVAESSRAGELLDVIKDASKSEEQFEGIFDSNIKRLIKKSKKGIIDVYQAEDDCFKIYGFENELARYKKAKPDANIAELEKEVAQIIRDTYPTYSLTPAATKLFRRVPLFGSFVSFPSEVIRTVYKRMALTKKEMSDKNPAVRKIGYKRLAGQLVAAGMVTAASAASRAFFGVFDDDEKDIKRFMAPWDARSEIIYTNRVDGGIVEYINMGFTDPHSYLKNPILTMLSGDNPKEAAIEAIKELYEPFLGEEILATALIDIARNKKKSTGQEVFNEQDDLADQVADMATHVGKALEPGTLTGFRGIWKGINQKVDEPGKKHDPVLTAIAMISGHKIQKLDVSQSFFFKTGAFTKDTRNARKLYTSVVFNDGIVTDEELEDAYEKANRRLKKLYGEMSKDYKAAISQGVKRNKILKIYKRNNMSRNIIKHIQDGAYTDLEKIDRPKRRK